ncbi:hypothetical protein, partial [Aneurinibacillus aneurinilyticus]|uniref:hypothetical protein n=1 Tax=Aneurinibacillus aneurinilyticus TaxID=1391 RepID=UPI003D22D524
HGVVTIHSGSYWIINTLVIIKNNYFTASPSIQQDSYLHNRITPTFKIGYIYLILKYKRTFSYIFLQNLTQKIVFNLYTSDLIHRHMFVAEGKNTY